MVAFEVRLRGSIPRFLPALALLAGAAGAQSHQLSGTLAGPASDVTAFAVGPAGRRAIYLADQDTPGVFELYSVPLDRSSAPVKLSGTMPASGDVTSFQSNKRRRIVYSADPTNDGVFELFSVPSDGSRPPVPLTPELLAGRQIFEFHLTPDGTRVVYSADQLTDNVYELFVAPIDGSASAQRVASGIGSFVLDSTSTHAFFSIAGYVFTSWYNAIYSVALVPASTPVKLHDGFQPPGARYEQEKVAPDGRWISFLESVDLGFGNETNLHLLSTDVSAPFGAELGYGHCSAGDFTDDSQTVVYFNGRASLQSVALYSSNWHEAEKLLSVLQPGRIPPIRIDGTTVFFADNALSRVPADGSAAPQILVPAAPHSYGSLLEVSPAGDWVAFVRHDTATNVETLFGVQSAGGPVVTLEVLPRSITQLQFARGSSTLVYHAGKELFDVPSDGQRQPHCISGPLPPGCTASPSAPFVVADDTVVFLASHTPGMFELFEAPIHADSHSASK